MIAYSFCPSRNVPLGAFRSILRGEDRRKSAGFLRIQQSSTSKIDVEYIVQFHGFIKACRFFRHLIAPHLATGTPGILGRYASSLPKEVQMTGKRELIEPNKGDKRFVRRDDGGRFSESDDVGKSLAQDQRRKAKAVAKKGQGDRGDRKAM